MKRSIQPWVMVLISLAGIGFLVRLVSDPLSLVKQLLITAVVVGVFFLIYKFMIRNRISGKQNPAYLKAAKQSRKRYSTTSRPRGSLVQSTKKQMQKSNRKPVKKTHYNKSHNLTVIEGKKGKKKNRAFF